MRNFQAGFSADGQQPDAAVFAGLAMELHGSDGVEETVEAVMEFALQALGCTHSGIVLRQKSGSSIVASDEVVEQINSFQLEYGDGPMIAAWRWAF